MTKAELYHIVVPPVDRDIYRQVKAKLDHVAKPLDGLGVFEHLIAQIGAIQKETRVTFQKRALLVMCADNGVVEEGVSQSGKEVTLAVAKAMGKNQSAVGKMAEAVGVKVFPIDIGIDTEEVIEGVENCKVRRGTRNFATEPALTEEETLRAIEVGMQLVCRCKREGYQLLATGEMGIGNTTTSTAVAAALLKTDVASIIGRGAGLDNSALTRKRKVIEKSIARYQLHQADAFSVLQTVGGLDIAGLAGVFIGAAVYQIPVIIDGVISAVAALAAQRLCKGVNQYMIPSHKSREITSNYIMEQLNLRPVIDADMALGEGTGAVMMISLLDIAGRVYQEGASFDSFEITQYERYSEGWSAFI